MLAGLYGVAVGYFTAVDWKTGESSWTLQAGLFVVGGLVFAIYAVAGAVRPSKAMFLPPLALCVVSSLLVISATVSDWLGWS